MVIINSTSLLAQGTNSQVTGRILSDNNETLTGATVIAIHEPTKNIFTTQGRADGSFQLFNLEAGGPYTITVSYAGCKTFVCPAHHRQ